MYTSDDEYTTQPISNGTELQETFPPNYHQDAKNRSSSVVREDENSLELNLKLQYLGHLMQRADSLEKTLMLGKIEDRRRRGQQMVGWHQ